MKRPILKICGITRREDAILAQSLGADSIGLIFTESARHVDISQAEIILDGLSKQLGRIGVFANASVEEILPITDHLGLTGVQLHGSESPEFVRSLRELRPQLVIIKTIIEGHDSLQPEYLADYLLLDTPRTSLPRSNLNIESLISRKPQQSFFAAGGINAANVSRYLRELEPAGIDVCSGVEASPGIKCSLKMKHFFQEVTRAIA